ncbi:MAG: hypothetical protein NZ455_02230 [Bacteroidia bacterium]|nr:hypothetical protein [Bacteroidia bacterium]MDW8347689.1 hypothetical protein [Bacteroidia bacterium]
MGTAFVACQKTNVETAPKTVKNEVKNNMRHTGGFIRQETYSNNEFIGCPNNGQNCFWPPIEICGNCTSHIPVLEEVFHVVENGNTTEIVGIFVLYREVLSEYYHKEYIDGVIDRTYTPSYSFYSNAHYLRFKQNQETIAIYPLVLPS